MEAAGVRPLLSLSLSLSLSQAVPACEPRQPPRQTATAASASIILIEDIRLSVVLSSPRLLSRCHSRSVRIKIEPIEERIVNFRDEPTPKTVLIDLISRYGNINPARSMHAVYKPSLRIWSVGATVQKIPISMSYAELVSTTSFLILLEKKYCVKVSEDDALDVSVYHAVDVRTWHGAGRRPAAVCDVQQGRRFLY